MAWLESVSGVGGTSGLNLPNFLYDGFVAKSGTRTIPVNKNDLVVILYYVNAPTVTGADLIDGPRNMFQNTYQAVYKATSENVTLVNNYNVYGMMFAVISKGGANIDLSVVSTPSAGYYNVSNVKKYEMLLGCSYYYTTTIKIGNTNNDCAFCFLASQFVTGESGSSSFYAGMIRVINDASITSIYCDGGTTSILRFN